MSARAEDDHSAPDRGIIPVLLVDDHEIWRRGLCYLLDGTEFQVVAEAATAQEALHAARNTRPRLALVDIRLADGDGFGVVSGFQEEIPDLLSVMLTTYNNPTFIARALACGAVGYLLKGVTRDELLASLRAVVRGEKLLAPADVLDSLESVSRHVAESNELFEILSEREDTVLRLLATGISNRDIGKILGIGEGTVKTHVINITHKLGAEDRTQVAVWAARQGSVDEVP